MNVHVPGQDVEVRDFFLLHYIDTSNLKRNRGTPGSSLSSRVWRPLRSWAVT